MYVIVGKSLREKQRAQALKLRLLAVHGVWQRNSEQIVTSAAGIVKNIDKAPQNVKPKRNGTK